ncbi:MAG TPA: DUF3421 domain-containing protein [Leptolyngbyaceae cyanobacterium]
MLPVVLLGLLVHPSAAFAWKPTMHVYLADQVLNDALDGWVTIHRVDYEGGKITGEIGQYPVEPTLLDALRNNPAQYRAGILGPDAYPDIATGQKVIHASSQDTGVKNGSDTWLQYLWDQLNSPVNNTSAVRAFVTGYLTHAAGDMYAHTFINNFSGGDFAIKPPAGPENAIKHIALEGYIDKRVDANALGGNFFDISIDGVDDFIYRTMVDARPGTRLDAELLRSDSDSTNFSIPRIYSTLRQSLETDIARSRAAAKACRWWDPRCSAVYLNLKADYEEAWRDDIDQGLRAWPGVSHEVAEALFFNPSRQADIQKAEDMLQRYATDHLISMSGAPDFVGMTAGAINDLVAAVTPAFLKPAIQQLKDDLLNSLLVPAIGMTKQDLKAYISSPEQYFDRIMNQGAGENVTLQRFNSQYLKIQDQGYNNPAESFDYRRLPAAYNTVTMSKLLLLQPSAVKDLLSDLGKSVDIQDGRFNAMLGFAQTLDGSNQWRNGMVFAQDCRVYRQLFMRQAGEVSCAVAAAPQPALQWTSASAGQVPEGAVLGGEGGGHKLYVCRANYQGGVHPGKTVENNCNIGYGGQEILVPDYEVLVQPASVALQWRPSSNGQVPETTVLGGQEPGRALYICRASYQGAMHPGKVVGSSCNIGYGGQEITLSDYDALVQN